MMKIILMMNVLVVKVLCGECTSWDWKYQFNNDAKGGMRYKGCMVVFDNRGRGKKYCIKCYNK